MAQSLVVRLHPWVMQNRVTWDQIVRFARELEDDAERTAVPPVDAALLVRLVLNFHRQIVVKAREPSTPGSSSSSRSA
jgi:hypothetical protein